jgi:hypothetical protein
MTEYLYLIQVLAMLASGPLLLLLAAYMVLQRPVVAPRYWFALVAVVMWFSIVSLRDWWVLNNNDVDFSPVGFVVRSGKFFVVLTAMIVAFRERTVEPVNVEGRAEREVRLKETHVRQNERDVEQDATEVRQNMTQYFQDMEGARRDES